MAGVALVLETKGSAVLLVGDRFSLIVLKSIG
jgi:hypothetical protein